MILKVLYRFLICYTVLRKFEMKLASKHGFSNVQLLIFHFLSKILINCVTRNKVARNERLSAVKHNNIIQDKILLWF